MSIRGANNKVKGLYLNSATLFSFKKIQSLQKNCYSCNFCCFSINLLLLSINLIKNQNDYTKF